MLKKTLQNYNLILGAATAKWPRSDKEQTEERQRQREGGRDRQGDRETDRETDRERHAERQRWTAGWPSGNGSHTMPGGHPGQAGQRHWPGQKATPATAGHDLSSIFEQQKKKQKLLLQVTKCATQTNEYSMRSQLGDLCDAVRGRIT